VVEEQRHAGVHRRDLGHLVLGHGADDGSILLCRSVQRLLRDTLASPVAA
jgi:hypothetical protein